MDVILSTTWYLVHALFFMPADNDNDTGANPIYPLTMLFTLRI